MSRDSAPTTRRRVLRYSGAALATLTTAGAASAHHYHPDVDTESPTDVSSSQATLEGFLSELDNASSVDVWFEWGKDGNGMPNKTSDQTISSDGTSFDESIGPLDSETKYEYEAYAQGNNVTEGGGVVHFWTDSGPSPESTVGDISAGRFFASR